ncbi:site-specific integrase [Vibrio aestuarianus]|uniref:site-specific integrase n=1 Tax=Vibrio aestuarianus TaxID=28171 RepID=UPI001594DA74|nr:site-specific integrase [Vibrio aestuarianus]MDE1236601.1 site-specific integrase [Vibrio aestuarianus]MDE1247480.1 site-specific integrase [Vibrio aestuarianus]NGZ63456.1 site-specific integrase [Vibrio aestuarianus subsp. cardii]
MIFKKCKITLNGEQHVFFTDEYGLPITSDLTVNWASIYLNKEKGSTTIRSKETTATHLLFCIEHFIRNDIDIIDRVANPYYSNNKLKSILTFFELDAFCKACFLKQEVIDREQNTNIASFTAKDAISPALKSATFLQNKVTNNTAASRMRIMRDFIDYLFKRYHDHSTLNYIEEIRQDVVSHINREIKKAKPEKKKAVDIDKPIFDEEALHALFEITQVDHPENPFKRRDTQVRNRVIIDTLFDIGSRRGALLAAKITDLYDENLERIALENRVNTDDPRLHRPSHKTQSGQVAMEPQTMQLLKSYIENERDSYPESENHDFIFISHRGRSRGQPLAITSFNYIFEVLSKVISEKLGRPIKISPHQIRHHWNNQFSDDCEKAGLSNSETDRLRKAQMTWSAKSEMAEVYNIRHTLKKVREIKQSYQSKMFYGEE